MIRFITLFFSLFLGIQTYAAQTAAAPAPVLGFTKTQHAGFYSMTLNGPTGVKIGYATYAMDTKQQQAQIKTIAINPLCHRKKFGSKLLSRVIKDCVTSGCHEITACVYPAGQEQTPDTITSAVYQKELQSIINFFTQNNFEVQGYRQHGATKYGAHMRYNLYMDIGSGDADSGAYATITQ
ncbi:MAG TPA: GNAT family N-acetyltransferase, partial [Candidatus Limnocylindria bacterium]|nr:GNAT family N-acetyltransferase [Candidatus Limnocylindria bacterium]